MARVGRLAGAILAETGGSYYLVGNTKVPCDWAAARFEAPAEIDALKWPYQRLIARGDNQVDSPHLFVELEGEALLLLLAEIFVIERTGSVSERLWRLVIGQSDEHDEPVPDVVAARWLGEVPKPFWKIVRDTVLRCS